MNENVNKFCNEFYPKHENYMFNPNIEVSNSSHAFSECRHCVHRNSPKCQHSLFQQPTFDVIGWVVVQVYFEFLNFF